MTTFRTASSCAPDPERAVAELAAELHPDPGTGTLFFCSSRYDRQGLASALRQRFPGPTIGCTTSGEIGPNGYQTDGIVAATFPNDVLQFRTWTLRDLRTSFLHATPDERAEGVLGQIQAYCDEPGAARGFGLLLIDGLSMTEEAVAAALYRSTPDMVSVGGSAGDDLRFANTAVFADGEFVEDAAIFAVFSTSLPFRVIKFQHFEPTRRRLVITAADPSRRVVHEINGRPAALALADALGVHVSALGAEAFSVNPVMLRLGNDWFVRALQKVNPDLSVTFYCAIEPGLVLSVGEGVHHVETVDREFARIRGEIGAPGLVIACDCILRRLEMTRCQTAASVGAVLASNNTVGFSTYGEQYNGIHINQTFTGIAIGSGR